MLVIGILLTRNESDILQENIEHHLAHGVDFIVATNNASTDRTKKILSDFQKKGFIAYFEDDSLNDQKNLTEKMVSYACEKLKPDFIVIMDTDEFWCATYGLKQYFEQIPNNINVIKVRRYQYFPTAQDSHGSPMPIYERMMYRETGKWIGFNTGIGSPENTFARHKLAFRVPASDFDIMRGNHTIHFTGRYPIVADDRDVMIREYPFRSYDLFLEKVRRADIVMSNSPVYQENLKLSTHYRKWVEMYKNGELEKFYRNNIYFDDMRLELALKEGILVRDDSMSRLDKAIFAKVTN